MNEKQPFRCFLKLPNPLLRIIKTECRLTLYTESQWIKYLIIKYCDEQYPDWRKEMDGELLE
jgi:hypothetical protein